MTLTSPNASLVALDAIAFDCETTGLDARSARIVQVGAVPLVKGTAMREQAFCRLVNPAVPIPVATTKVHGITDADVAREPPFTAIAGELKTFLGERPLIGHSISFDLAMLAREYEIAGLPWPRPRALDIRLLGRIVAPTLAEHDLDRLCAWLGVEIEGRHTALGDATAAAQAFLALVPMLRARGIRTIAEAEAACVELAERDARATGGLFVSEGRAAAAPAASVKLDTFAYRHRVSDVMSAPAVVLGHAVSLREAVGLMIAKGLSSVFVRLEAGDYGIVTERDALRALHEHADAAVRPVGAIAKFPLLGVEHSDFVYRAIGRMERLGIRHLAVRSGPEIVGALTPRNLLRNRATQSIVIGDGIAGAATVAELAQCWAEAPAMTTSLLAENVDARLIASVLSSDICGMTQRAAELATEGMLAAGRGPAPASFCVLVLGSAGRGESLLAADQDNAIVFEAGERGGQADAWFAEMAQNMCEMLDQAGIPLCKGGVMARNEAWRHSRQGWDERVRSWVRRQKPEDLLNVDIFFDAVAVHGDGRMAEDLLAHASELARRSPDFLMMLTELARQWHAPFTLLGNFQKSNGRVDCKKAGLMPIFTGARVLALRHGVDARSTRERLKGVQERGAASPDTVRRILEAHEVLMRNVLQQQIIDGQHGVKLSPNVDVDRLDKGARKELKDAILAVREIVDLVSEGRL
ncbi:MAG: DUF294 nucleotidyltransferase-like domain-containing protein [Hyphomicrobiaceae bacterium]|nr:DUF294 nucleotidyltransferase-like domain-containing protein [Hyphomicrobiaceae bacterium]